MGAMLDTPILSELFWVFVLSVYALVVFLLTKRFYYWMIKKTHSEKVALYYNRKLIHIFAGGVTLLVVPFVFPTSPWYPLLFGLILTFITYMAHRSGKIFYWFQTEDNLNDVSFCFMWGLTIFVLWMILGSPWIAIIPPAFMAFGDGITGIVRNLAFKERQKHPIGNIYMLGVCIPIGYFFATWSDINGLAVWGVIAAVVASLFERFEFGPLDDNVLITLSATIVLYIGSIVGPIL
jgi:hypothetical protein